MKILLVLEVVVALAFSEAVPQQELKADKIFLQKQMNYLKLFHRIQQHNLFQDQVDIGDHYDIDANIGHYKYPHVVKNFTVHYKKGFLPRGQPFSVYNEKHREQAIKLFELYLAANDHDIFYKTACWARDRVNEGMFMYALTVAAFHREDTKDFVLPPPYEIDPYLFTEDYVLQQAYKYWTKESGTDKHVEHVIPVNFTARNQENLLAYFREDVDLNAFNMYFRYIYPSWFNTTLYGKSFDRRGEQFYYTYHQIYARYFLERLSNSLPDVKHFQYSKPLKTGYNPHLRYQNGEEMPARPSNMYPTDIDLFYIDDIKNYESSVEQALSFGFVFDEHITPRSLFHDKHGMDYIGEMIEGTSNSQHQLYYGSLFHFYCLLVGRIVDPYHKNGLAPSALEHHQTALRDPAFYQLWKRIDHIDQKYKDRLPRYTHDELSFPGVKVENVDVDKLYTYFENFEYSLDNAMYIGTLEDYMKASISARHYRLNHKPFTYYIEVSSDKAQVVYVRIFLGPKYDILDNELELNDRRQYFVEMDRFIHKVKAGKTVIERKSHDSSIISDSHDSYRILLKKVTNGLQGKDQYYIDRSHKYCGYPENLLLPKGKKGGQTFTFYVIVTPYVKQDEHDFEPYHYKAFSYCGVGHGRKYPDDKPLGFPFDRKIHDYDFYTPNMYFKDVVIFHEKYDEIHDVTH
ncbi:allergen Cr-PI-like [Periplaneta americana]|uniref:allergen Cr-PI-like n=1 Tax=Periplaneta americana TaxID=6978 RepID=UPI0037E79E56